MSNADAPTTGAETITDVLSPLVSSICSRIANVSPYTGTSDHPAISVEVDSLHAVMQSLNEDPTYDFAVFFSHTAVDRIETQQFELLYFLHSLNYGHRLLVSVMLPRLNPVAPTLCDIWKIAEWQEREVFDLFGIQYDGHPDLRRLFLEDDWKGYPLRKDYVDDFMLTRDDKEAQS